MEILTVQSGGHRQVEGYAGEETGVVAGNRTDRERERQVNLQV